MNANYLKTIWIWNCYMVISKTHDMVLIHLNLLKYVFFWRQTLPKHCGHYEKQNLTNHFKAKSKEVSRMWGHKSWKLTHLLKWVTPNLNFDFSVCFSTIFSLCWCFFFSPSLQSLFQHDRRFMMLILLYQADAGTQIFIVNLFMFTACSGAVYLTYVRYLKCFMVVILCWSLMHTG